MARLFQNAVAAIVALLVAIAVLGEPALAEGRRKPLVVLVGLDGFRPDYLGRGNSPTLDRLAAAGATARGLVPAFPSATFPNHYSMVTGLVPDRHGVVNNQMMDPTVPGRPFSPGARDAVTNGAWWSEGTPIWVTLKRQGRRTSTLFWPGTEAPIHGLQPDDWLAYDDSLTSAQRTDKLLGWLARPDSERAELATLYFSEVDVAGHRFGPDSPDVEAAVKRADDALARLLAGLEAQGLTDVTDIVIVADHGMAALDKSHTIDIRARLSGIETAKVRWSGGFAGIVIEPAEREKALAQLRAEPRMSCWPKADIPGRFRFGTHRRVPDILCLADVGWLIVDNPFQTFLRGGHGYDPVDPSMWGVFIATGPRIKPERFELVDNVDVYPLLCRLLGVTPEPGDWRETLVKAVVK